MPNKLPVLTTDDYLAGIFGQAYKQQDRLATKYVPYVVNNFWQRVYNCQKRGIIILAPRDWGKTAGCVQFFVPGNPWCVAQPGKTGMWLSIEYRHITQTFLPELKTRVGGVRFNKDESTVYMPNGCEIWTSATKDADNVDRILGKKFPDFWFGDEIAFAKHGFLAAMIQNVREDSRVVLFTSKKAGSDIQTFAQKIIANGGDDYWEIFEPDLKDPNENHPAHIPLEIWEQRLARRLYELPRAIYERDVLNMWGAPEGAVFLGVNDAWLRGEKMGTEPEPELPLAFGLDLGQAVDYTALVACAGDGATFPLFHARGMPWDDVAVKVKAILDRYPNGMPVWVDSTGYGAPVLEILMKHGIKCYGVDMGSLPYDKAPMRWKEQLVLDLSLALERGQVTLARSPMGEELMMELHNYLYHPLPSGGYRYEADSGQHDDLVTAAMLAWSASRRMSVITKPKHPQVIASPKPQQKVARQRRDGII